MRKIILFISIYLLSAVLYADNLGVTLGWIPSCDTNVIGSRLYYGIAPTTNSIGVSVDFQCETRTYVTNDTYQVSFSNMVDIPNLETSYTVSNLVAGSTYVFSITAYDAEGIESPFSSQAIYQTPDVYTRTPPKQTFAIASYTTNWFAEPVIETDEETGRTYTNYYSLTVRTFRLSSDLYVRTNWVILVNTNLAKTNWMVYKYGSNSVPAATITNVGGAAFFRIQL